MSETETEIKRIKEELQVFSKFHFEEEPHLYWWEDKKGEKRYCKISMTSLIHEYSQPFDKYAIAPLTAKKMNISTEEVLKKWDYENLFSKVKGTHIHAFNEYLWQNKNYFYPVEEVEKQLGEDALKDIWDKLTSIAKNFYRDFKDKIIPIGLELVIGDEDFGIGGSIDFLCYSLKLKSLIIIDYKSNKEIKFTPFNRQKMLGCLSHIDDCNYNHYSLQLNGYQYIIEKNTNLKLNNEHFIVWINEKNDSYEIFKTRDLYKEAKDMINEKLGLPF